MRVALKYFAASGKRKCFGNGDAQPQAGKGARANGDGYYLNIDCRKIMHFQHGLNRRQDGLGGDQGRVECQFRQHISVVGEAD